MLEKEPENFMETVFYSLSTYSSGWQQVEKLRHSVFSTIFSGLCCTVHVLANVFKKSILCRHDGAVQPVKHELTQILSLL